MASKRRVFPAFDPKPLLPKLRDWLLEIDSALGELSNAPFDVAARQLSPREGLPHPCRRKPVERKEATEASGQRHEDPCRACAIARAVLLLETRTARVADAPLRPGMVAQPGAELRRLVDAAVDAERTLRRLEPLLADHLGRWSAYHDAMQGAGKAGTHDHRTLCVLPSWLLSNVQTVLLLVQRLAPALAEQFPQPLTPGSTRGDVVLRDFVYELQMGGVKRREIARLLSDTFGQLEPEYWIDRVRWAQRTIRTYENALASGKRGTPEQSDGDEEQPPARDDH